MSLITLETFKTLKNITDTTNDALYTQLLSIATVQIENWCDRIFSAADYIEWIDVNSCNQVYITRQYPIIRVKYIGSDHEALKLTNNDTIDYIFDITDTTLTINDETLSETTYDLSNAANDTLTELVSVMNTSYSNITVVIDSTVSQTSKLLKPGVYTLIAGDTIDIVGSKVESNNSKVKNDGLIYGISSGVIVYKAGYETIPLDLQLACANIVYDTADVLLNDKTGNYKSESITNYSYTLADGIKLQNIINGYINTYSDTLNYYKKVSF